MEETLEQLEEQLRKLDELEADIKARHEARMKEFEMLDNYIKKQQELLDNFQKNFYANLARQEQSINRFEKNMNDIANSALERAKARWGLF